MNFEQKQKSRGLPLLWIGFTAFTIAVYIFFSSYDFSFILTLAAEIQCFGFGTVMLRTYLSRDFAGVSWNTFMCCGLALFGRLSSILIFEGYLPVDRSGDHVYKLFEALSFFFCASILFMMKNTLTRQSQEHLEGLKWYILAPPSFILAVLIHPGLNYYSPLDILWTFGMYLECFALLPQILLFSKRDDIEDYTSNFIVSLVLSKFISFVFWVSSFRELNENHNTDSFSIAPTTSGFFVIGAQFIQIVLTLDFLYLYLRSWQTGIPIARLPH